MLAKPLNIILVYILTISNFTILLLPILAIIFPFIDFENQKLMVSDTMSAHIKSMLVLLVFAVSFLMLCYLFLDLIFGFSLSSSLKGCKNYKRVRDYQFLKEIFDQTKKKFAQSSVKLYVQDSSEINAFAIGSLGRRAIVLTSGLINHYRKTLSDDEEFLFALRGIIGHEMSHLINKDFLPGLLVITNQKATNFVSFILNMILKLILTIFGFLGMRNNIIASLLMMFYNLASKILFSFNSYIVYNLYEFLRKFISRSVEYRCDRQSAYAFGGDNMGLALSLLGPSGYFTLFSTHPTTQKRVKRVENIAMKKGTIRPPISSSIANYISIMLLVTICAVCAKAAKVDIWLRHYLTNNSQQIYDGIEYLRSVFNNLIF